MTQDAMKDAGCNWPKGVRIQRIEAANCGYSVGAHKIEMTMKAGEYAFIPYVRVLDYHGRAVAEFSQHSLLGVFYEPDPDQEPTP